MNYSNLSQLKKLLSLLVLEVVRGGSQPEEAYNIRLIDDDAFNSDSIYVPKQRKDVIKKWLKSMKLD